MAWYSGSGECQNDQSVHVISIVDSKQSEPLRVGDCTGNPVLVPDGSDAVLLWSKFEDGGRIKRLADRWKTCSLWVQRIGVRDGEVQFLGDKELFAEPEQHLLGRCNPLLYNDKYLLPLYDEVNRDCVIFEGAGLEWEEISRYGTDMIQPTLWITSNGKVGSLTRNFTRGNRKSFFCESNGGRAWSEPTPTRLWNLNNSIHAINWNGEEIILWNDTPGRWRENMTLGVLKSDTDELGFLKLTAEPVAVVGAKHGSYPSMCIDSDNNLNFSFTDSNRQIEYHVWNHKFFRERRNNPVGRTGGRDQDNPRFKAKAARLL